MDIDHLVYYGQTEQKTEIQGDVELCLLTPHRTMFYMRDYGSEISEFENKPVFHPVPSAYVEVNRGVTKSGFSEVSRIRSDLQLANIPSIFVTFLILNDDRSSSCKLLHPENICNIVVTFEVFHPDRFTCSKFGHKWKVPLMLVTFDVSHLCKSKFVSPRQLSNVLYKLVT